MFSFIIILIVINNVLAYNYECQNVHNIMGMSSFAFKYYNVKYY